MRKLLSIILLVCLANCILNTFSELSIRRNDSKNTLGRLKVVFRDGDIDYLRKMQIRLTRIEPVPSTELTISLAFLPLIIPRLQKINQVIPPSSEIFADGYLKNGKEYFFYLEEGTYYASIGNTFLDYESNDSVFYNYENGIDQMVFLQFTAKERNKCFHSLISDPATLVTKAIFCAPIHIKKGGEAKIEISGGLKEIDYLKTFMIWLPLSVILAPYFLGPIRYAKNFSVTYSEVSDDEQYILL